MTIRYNKLVRDRIPEIIESEGSECNVRVLDNAEFSLQKLDYKLAEELSEYQESKELEELVDIVELMRGIVARNGAGNGRTSNGCAPQNVNHEADSARCSSSSR
ncbi:MAG: nucleoside triphosphate pyrophosphohydrolase [Thermomicrobiales bacterium]